MVGKRLKLGFLPPNLPGQVRGFDGGSRRLQFVDRNLSLVWRRHAGRGGDLFKLFGCSSPSADEIALCFDPFRQVTSWLHRTRIYPDPWDAAATQIPLLLTCPLVDNVLSPHQNWLEMKAAGKDPGPAVSFSMVPYYLLGLILCAILAWLLSWAKTYVLASVGEQISADLRNQTYEHLQKLSLEFFGGKRTGDLISRVSTDTQRICDFLSMQLIDFGSDLVMIFLTATALIALDPWMSLWTLLPFPVIAWMINRVRNRMRHGFARGNAAWSEMVRTSSPIRFRVFESSRPLPKSIARLNALQFAINMCSRPTTKSIVYGLPSLHSSR